MSKCGKTVLAYLAGVLALWGPFALYVTLKWGPL